jgi:hypothetical protein
MTKFQTSNCLVIGIGDWNLFDVWDLVIGAYHFFEGLPVMLKFYYASQSSTRVF